MHRHCVLPFLCAALLGACGEAPKGPGVPTTFDAVCDKANDGKRLSLEGYVDFPASFKSKETSIMMRLRPALDQRNKVVGVGVPLGNGPNQVEMPPKRFTSADMKVHTQDGKVLGFRDKVKVSGTMYTPSSLADVEFKCGLSNVMVEGAAQ
jgi:hypothetical protein